VRPVHAHEVAADRRAVDVHGEEPSFDRLEARDVTHPPDEQPGVDEVIEDLLGRGADVDAGAVNYELKFGPFGALMDALVMRRTLNSAIRDVFANLKRYVETRSRS
jgi:hypothetical protein